MDLPDAPPPAAPTSPPPAGGWDRLLALVDRLRDDRAVGTVVAVVALAVVAAGYAGFRAIQPPAPPRAEEVLPRVGLTPTSAVTPTTTAAPVVVHVVGAVAEPGVRLLPAGARVLDAVTAAGGPTADADLAQLNLAAAVVDGSQVRVPAVGETPSGPLVVGPAPGAADGGSASPAGPVDLNTADAVALEALPGVGPATAAAIVAWRDANGPFRSVDQLLEVRGIGPAKFEALRDLVVVR